MGSGGSAALRAREARTGAAPRDMSAAAELAECLFEAGEQEAAARGYDNVLDRPLDPRPRMTFVLGAIDDH
jgi:hypothetical protein